MHHPGKHSGPSFSPPLTQEGLSGSAHQEECDLGGKGHFLNLSSMILPLRIWVRWPLGREGKAKALHIHVTLDPLKGYPSQVAAPFLGTLSTWLPRGWLASSLWLSYPGGGWPKAHIPHKVVTGRKLQDQAFRADISSMTSSTSGLVWTHPVIRN